MSEIRVMINTGFLNNRLSNKKKKYYLEINAIIRNNFKYILYLNNELLVKQII